MSEKEDLLATLRDIQLPPPPEAPSVALLLAFGLCALLIIAYLIVRRSLRSMRRVDFVKTQIACARCESPEQARLRLARLLRLLSDVSPVHGDRWLEALNAQYKTQAFTQAPANTFGQLLYKPVDDEFDLQALCDLLEPLLSRRRQRLALSKAVSNERLGIARGKA